MNTQAPLSGLDLPPLGPDRQALLSRTLSQLLLAEDPDRIIRELFPQVAQHLGVDTYFNYMVHEPGRTLELHSCAGIPDAVVRTITHLRFGEAICGTVAQLRQPIVAEDIQRSDYDKAALVRGLGITCYACNPLLVGDDLMGTLSFASHSRPRFTEEELAFIAAVTHYTAIAMYRLRTARQLHEKAELLSAMDARKNAFINGLGHELRDPLVPLSNSLHVLRMPEASPQDKAEMMDLMERQMRHLVRLVDDLLDVSRVATGRLDLERQEVDIRSSIRIAAEQVNSRPDRPDVRVHAELGEAPCLVNGDPARLAQIFSNLLAYAVRQCDRATAVQLALTPGSEQHMVELRYEGTPVRPAALLQVFDLFKRPDHEHGRTKEGLGVGLALAKHLVLAQGGDLSAEPVPNGVCFHVRLPRARAVAA